MDPGFSHFRYARNGAGQFPLQGPLVIEVLHEISGAQSLAIEELEAHPAAPGHAFTGQHQPILINLGSGHQNGASPPLEAIGDFLAL